jgi:uncharacterized protein
VLAIPDNADLIVEAIAFPSGGSRLHGELVYAESAGVTQVAVIAGPHPLLGGHMHNNVVCGLSEGLALRGLPVVRFDYRGIGRSEGAAPNVAARLAEFWHSSHVSGELDLWQDVQAAVEYARPVAGPRAPLILIGYSFGCVLLPQVRVDASVIQILVAPTVAKHDYEPFVGLDRPTLVIAAPDDFAADPAQLRAWFDRLSRPKQLILRPGDSHFFRGYEDWLAETTWTFLNRLMETPS